MNAADPASREPQRKTFRTFFFKGLGILLPTVLTIWILVAVYNFVDEKIANPINAGIRQLVLVSGWPEATDDDYLYMSARLEAAPDQEQAQRQSEIVADWNRFKQNLPPVVREDSAALDQARLAYARNQLQWQARRHRLAIMWDRVRIGNWAVLDLTGLVVAIVLIYMVGRLLGGFLGARLYARGEALLRRLPVFKQVYPYVKQVTDFFVGDRDESSKFSNVIAVQYPRMGMWSIGLVTGDTMQDIQTAAGHDCLTVFIPSSPTPFTGYVITVPRKDTVDLPITIDEALRFCVSGGVIVPDKQVVDRGADGQPILPGLAGRSPLDAHGPDARSTDTPSASSSSTP
jgi:uncharacterized membrane protein